MPSYFQHCNKTCSMVLHCRHIFLCGIFLFKPVCPSLSPDMTVSSLLFFLVLLVSLFSFEFCKSTVPSYLPFSALTTFPIFLHPCPNRVCLARSAERLFVASFAVLSYACVCARVCVVFSVQWLLHSQGSLLGALQLKNKKAIKTFYMFLYLLSFYKFLYS